ncbi:MAG TPA: FAD-binding oxidoreductase [Candidatus Binatia bacterium]|nr:FAD-binding oxidoreductase [Candidatus Binatia bacterium]
MQERIAGRITKASDATYDTIRRDLVWHELEPARYPAAIVHVASEQDVVEAIRFARDRKLNVAVRGGGHNWAGFSLRNESLLVDLGDLTDAAIDANARTAVMQPVVRSQAFVRRLEEQGVSFPVGHCPTVPLGGFLLNGGLGWNSNKWRPACFSVEAANVITADGQILRVSERENAELLWAVRGAGPGFFGVVTRYFLRLFPGPRAITSSLYYYPMDRVEALGRWFASAVHELPEEAEVLVFFTTAPPDIADRCRSSNGYTALLSATAFVDTAREASDVLGVLDRSPLARECLKTELDVPTPISSLLDRSANLWPERHRYLADTVWSNAPSAQVLATVRDHFLRSPSQQCLGTVWFSTGPNGVASRHPDAAFSMTAQTLTLCYGIWKRPEEDAAMATWHGKMMADLDRLAVGHYVGESDIVRDPRRHERSFAEPSWRRLQELRRRYDPEGLFLGPYTARDKGGRA